MAQPEEFRLDGEVFVRDLLPSHREILLDVVLAWARVDTAMTEFLGAIDESDLLDTFDKFQRRSYASKKSEILSRLEVNSDTFDRMKIVLSDFDNHLKCRHRIVHSNINGYQKSNPDYLLFFVAERYGDGFKVDLIHIKLMRASWRYADELQALLRDLSDVHYGPRGASR